VEWRSILVKVVVGGGCNDDWQSLEWWLALAKVVVWVVVRGSRIGNKK